MTTATTMTARDVLAALYRHFNGRWAMITEVTARAPRESVEQLLQRARAGEDIRAEHERQRERHRERRIDALLLRMADVDGGIELPLRRAQPRQTGTVAGHCPPARIRHARRAGQ
jgi:hypothetical protein